MQDLLDRDAAQRAAQQPLPAVASAKPAQGTDSSAAVKALRSKAGEKAFLELLNADSDILSEGAREAEMRERMLNPAFYISPSERRALEAALSGENPGVFGELLDRMIDSNNAYVDYKRGIVTDAWNNLSADVRSYLSKSRDGLKRGFDGLKNTFDHMIGTVVGREDWEDFKQAWNVSGEMGALADDVIHYEMFKGIAGLTGAKSSDEAIFKFAQTYGNTAQDALVLIAASRLLAEGGIAALNQAGQYRLVVDRLSFGANGGNLRFVKKNELTVGQHQGPAFPTLKDHFGKHGLTKEAYYGHAVKNMNECSTKAGIKVNFRHDGVDKLAHIKRTSKEHFTLTVTNQNQTRIYTHFEEATKDYLSNKGITLPKGF